MASNAVFFPAKSYISSIANLGKVTFSKVLIADPSFLFPIHFIEGKKKVKATHPNVSHNLKKVKKERGYPN